MQELIFDFIFGTGHIKQGIAPLAIAGIAQGVSSLIGAFSAGKQRRDARRAAEQYEKDLSILEANRQNIVNPYANMKDLTSMVTNPFANLQVATQAAEMQARETDITLASTLDTLRATGSAAGGATALAQAAARAKQGVSASIEQQEAQNAIMRAKGEQQMQQLRMESEMRRQQLIGMGESQRMSMQESREIAQLDRASDLIQQQRIIEQQARSAQNQAIGGLVGTAASMGVAALGGAFNNSNSLASNGALNAYDAGAVTGFNTSNMGVSGSFTGAARAGLLNNNFVSQYGDPFAALSGKYINNG